MADKSLQEHKKRLQEEKKETKYVAAAFENVEKQPREAAVAHC